jgi:endogenous inhibitor of DNA gyrase (YacG/DUF329 family)
MSPGLPEHLKGLGQTEFCGWCGDELPHDQDTKEDPFCSTACCDAYEREHDEILSEQEAY